MAQKIANVYLSGYHLRVDNYCKNKELELSKWLEERTGQEFFKPGLQRIAPLFKPIIEQLQSQAAVITVAGTNGKGEVSFCIERLLRAAGKTVGLWTSPHVLSIRERFCFGGINSSYQQLKESFLATEKFIEIFRLSYYEFLFYNFLSLACDRNCQYLVLEVGLGGRFDAVNLLEPCICAITSIGRDHQEILGRSYRQILREKLGITRKGVPLLTAFDLNYLKQRTRQYCQSQGVAWTNLELTGDYSSRNQALASSLVEQLLGHLGECGQVTKGRFERIKYGAKELCFLGAHNLAGMRAFTESNRWHEFDLILVAFSKRDLKEIESCIKLLSNLEKKIIQTSFDHPKAMPGDQGYLDWKVLLEDGVEQNILITGSYYFIGEVQKYIFDRH